MCVSSKKYHEFCPTITHSVCSNLFVAFVCDPLDLDLFPPHVSAVAVGGAKEEAWSRPKMINKGFFPSMERLGHCYASSPCTLGRLTVTQRTEEEERKNRAR